MLTFTPKTSEEAAFRTRTRLGLLALILFVGWIAYRIILAIWPVLLCVAILWVVVRVVVVRRRKRNRH
jgi:hypothetical protein